MQSHRKRKPIIALSFSLVTPGLGQVYNGQLAKGVILYLSGFVLKPLLLTTGLFYKFYGMIVAFSIIAVYFLLILGDAFLSAKNIKTFELKSYNKWYIYILIILIFSLLIDPLIASQFYNKISCVKPYSVFSASMEPALFVGDHIIVSTRHYKLEKPARGDIIVFSSPRVVSQDLIKRVVGLGGDQILIKDKKIYVNDKLYFDPYGIYKGPTIISGNKKPRDNFGPVVVKKDSLFVMGDNRDRSHDSRFFGFISENRIKGKVLYIYWAKDKTRIGTHLKVVHNDNNKL